MAPLSLIALPCRRVDEYKSRLVQQEVQMQEALSCLRAVEQQQQQAAAAQGGGRGGGGNEDGFEASGGGVPLRCVCGMDGWQSLYPASGVRGGRPRRCVCGVNVCGV